MHVIRRHLNRFRRDARGSVLIEFALVLTVLLLLVFGIIDFGRLLFTANNLTAAAREGARYAAILPALPNDDAIKDTVIARTAVLGGGAITRSNVTVTYNVASGNYHSITVQVSDTFNYLTPVAPLLGLGTNRPITTRSQFRWESAP